MAAALVGVAVLQDLSGRMTSLNNTLESPISNAQSLILPFARIHTPPNTMHTGTVQVGGRRDADITVHAVFYKPSTLYSLPPSNTQDGIMLVIPL